MQKQLIIKALTALLLLAFVSASAVGQTAVAGKDGIFIYLGKDLPKKFSYVIERKATGDTGWQQVAETVFPKTQAALQGNFYSMPTAIAGQMPGDSGIAFIWQRLLGITTLDSLYPYATQPMYIAATGCGFYDKVSAVGKYTYRVSTIRKGIKLSEVYTDVSFPGKPYQCSLTPESMAVADNAIDFTINFSDTTSFGTTKVFRAKYGDSIFKQVPATILFTAGKNGKLQLNVIDAAVTPKMAYSYYFIPVDYLGNEGSKSDVLNVYNASKIHEIGQVLKIEAKGIDTAQAIKLAWKLNNPAELISVDIYRSTTYNSEFTRVASVGARDTIFIDNSVLPATTYYYSITANGNFGRGNPSARVNAVVKGTRSNLFPPENITVSRTGNIIAIRFTRLEKDTRGYYVYRAAGYKGKLAALQHMLLSTDSANVYYDTLPFSATPKIYSYAVADVNTSYNISPQSQRVSVLYSGAVPIPVRVNAVRLGGNVMVVWNKPNANQLVSGYNVYRIVTDEGGKVVAGKQLLNKVPVDGQANSYVDSSAVDGFHYSYAIQAIGAQSDDLGSLSGNASITLPAILPLAPANVSASGVNQNVNLRWDVPADSSIKSINIYRAAVNGDLKLIKTVDVATTTFSDADVTNDATYFYALSTTNTKNRESKKTDLVGVRVR